MDLTVAVINYNTRGHLRRCLESLTARDTPLDLMVIDNASPDGSAQMVEDDFSDKVVLHANQTNFGFAHAVNQALLASHSRYLLVLNADTETPEGAIEALYDFMERSPRCALAGGRLEDPEGNLQPSCRTFYDSTTLLLRRTPLAWVAPEHPALREHMMLDWDHEGEPRQVDWMQGACLMLRREATDEVGAMDERFHLYFEDVDLCKRMAAAGWQVCYVPQARFVHHYRRGSHGGLLSREKLHHIQSGLRYLAKWNPLAGKRLRLLQRAAPALFLLLDLGVINGGFYLCLLLRDLVGGPMPVAVVTAATYHPMLAGTNVLLLLTFSLLGLYRIERSKDWLALAAAAIKAVTWVALLGGVVLFFTPGYRHGFVYSRLLMLLYYLTLICGVSAIRLIWRGVLRLCWRHRLLLRRVILLGERDAFQTLADAVRREPDCGYEVAAALELPEDGTDASGQELIPRFDELIREQQPGGAIFVTNQQGFHPYVPLVLRSFEANLEVRVATSPQLFPFIQRSGARDICGLPAADVTRTPLYALKRWLKRLSDIALTLLLLPLVGPAMGLLALVIRFSDGGPGFFRQKRVGKGGRPFMMVKLRTMRVNATVDQQANVAEGPLTRIPNDPRVTAIGRLLRRHKIDELPQLFNVLLGHMSLVGPRPPLAEEVEQYTEWQKGRLAVRPGITGLWQIDKKRKWRFDEMVELDLQYILNWSPFLDYGVILRTVPAVLRGS